MVKTGGHGVALLAVGLLILGIGWSTIGRDGVMLTESSEALLVENSFYTALVDLAHGGSLTALTPWDTGWPAKDILDNFRIQVIIHDDPPITSFDLLDDDSEGAWVWHGGPGFPPNKATSTFVLRCEPDAAIVRVKAHFMEQVELYDWERTTDSGGMTAEITYYFFSTRMFFVTWTLHFLEDKEVRRASIEAIPMAFAADLYPRHWAYWSAGVGDVEGTLRDGLFKVGWNHVRVTPKDLGERWLDTWGDDLGFGRIILDFDELEPHKVLQLCAMKPPNVENKRWTGHVDAWIDVPRGEQPEIVPKGTVYSATMLYTVHPGDYSYMQILSQKLQTEIPDLKARVEEIRGLEHLFVSHPFAAIEDGNAIQLIKQLAEDLQAVERAVGLEY